MGVTTTSPHLLAGWTPIQVGCRDGRPVVSWCFTEGIEFTDPFFHQTVAPHFGFEAGPPELALFASVAERDAKNPAVPFVRGAANHARDTPELRAMVDGRVGPVYAALEATRESRS